MPRWHLHVPHRSRGESLVDVAGHARHLPDPDDRAVARELALGAYGHGMRDAGELLDHLEQLDPAQRRAMLDNARAEVGLDSTSEADIRRGAGLLNLGPDRRPMTLVHTENGPIREVFADDQTTGGLDERRLAVEAQARDAERAVEAEHVRRHRLARLEQLQRELPAHLKPRPETP